MLKELEPLDIEVRYSKEKGSRQNAEGQNHACQPTERPLENRFAGALDVGPLAFLRRQA